LGVALPPQRITLLVIAKKSNLPSLPNAPSNVIVTPQ